MKSSQSVSRVEPYDRAQRALTIRNNSNLIRTYVSNSIFNYLEKPHWHILHTVLITPKGKNKTHDSYKDQLLKDITSIKSVKYCFLVPESDNTDHYHGIIATKRPCKFTPLTKKTNTYTFKYSPLYHTHKQFDFFTYITKHNPANYLKYEERNSSFQQLAF